MKIKLAQTKGIWYGVVDVIVVIVGIVDVVIVLLEVVVRSCLQAKIEWCLQICSNAAVPSFPV